MPPQFNLGAFGAAASEFIGAQVANVALSLAPQLVPGSGNRYEPSPFSLDIFTQPLDNYVWEEAPGTYNGNLKILVFMTAEQDMTMANGHKFVSGNHPVETLVPMIHLAQAGFDFDFATPGGKPGVIEHWALPLQDKPVMDIYNAQKDRIANPLAIEDIDVSLDGYAAIYLPGGHGAMLGLPEHAGLGALIRSAHEQSLPTITICHGPAALLSANIGRRENEPFIYDGYKIVVFPDVVDEYTPSIGYLPGPMPWWLEASLEDLGMTSTTVALVQGQVTRDRELVSGDSPVASNAVGKLATPYILSYVETQQPGSVTRPNRYKLPSVFGEASDRVRGFFGVF